MKPISDILKKLSSDKRKDLAKILHCKPENDRDILQSTLSVEGINALLRTLDSRELEIIKTVYNGGDGATLGELEKATHTGIPELENYTASLSQKLLLYVIKNRQLLTNKLDKIYGIHEIAEYINIKETADIHEKLKKIKNALESKTQDPDALKKVDDARTLQFLTSIAEAGGIMTFEEVASRLTPQSLNKTIEHITGEKLVSITHSLEPEFHTYIILNDKLASSLVSNIKGQDTASTELVRNRYRFALNILYTYDAISTFGLFLTKQMKFRKIDQKRIVDAMLPVRDIRGREINPEETAQLVLFFLHRMKSLNIHKDVATISITSLKNDLEEPQSLLVRMLHCLEQTDHINELFLPMTEIPSYKVALSIMKTLQKLPEMTLEHLKIATLTGLMASAPSRQSMRETIGTRQSLLDQFEAALNLLCVTGIIEIIKHRISLSDIGVDVISRLTRSRPPATQSEAKKCIYINPDFSLIVPVEEIPSLSLYHIMTHTDIVKDDVILNAMITRSSIVTAHKRGLSLKIFIDTLNAYSKNQIPQNMKFLLNEWSRQTLRITVTEAILLKTSHPTFLDEITFGKKKGGIIERISPNHAIVDIKYLDDIIKIARKHDVVISLFENLEEE